MRMDMDNMKKDIAILKNTSSIFKTMRANYISKFIPSQGPHAIVIKVTDNCNLACRYCYRENERKKSVIDPDTVLSLFDQLAESSNSEMECILHGGEPLAEMEVCREICDKINNRYYAPRIQFRIQTNGTIINGEVIDMIKKYNIGIGVSLDGVLDVHDKYRQDCNGRGTFDTVMQGINKLKAEDLLSVGVLCTVASHNSHRLVDFLELAKQLSLSGVALSPFSGSADSDMTPDNKIYAKGFREAVEWLEHHNLNAEPDKRMRLRELDSIIYSIIYPDTPNKISMCYGLPCGAGTKHISIECDGRIYACDCLCDIEEAFLGNINETALADILGSPKIKYFSEYTSNNLEECSECDIKGQCGGHCPSRKIAYYGENSDWRRKRSHQCNFYQEIIAYLRKRMKEPSFMQFAEELMKAKK